MMCSYSKDYKQNFPADVMLIVETVWRLIKTSNALVSFIHGIIRIVCGCYAIASEWLLCGC